MQDDNYDELSWFDIDKIIARCVLLLMILVKDKRICKYIASLPVWW